MSVHSAKAIAILCFSPILLISALAGCDGVDLNLGDVRDIIDILDNANSNANDNSTTPEPVVFANAELTSFASNTGGASGMAVRPSDGAVFVVSSKGIFGPIVEGDDLDMQNPIGATNLSSADLFRSSPTKLVLGITSSGEFWIGSSCCSTLAVVPPEGGDAQPFLGLLQGATPANITAETMAVAPANVALPGVSPGFLLASNETTFSRLAAIDVDGDRSVSLVDNPSNTNREGHHITFGPDGVMYASRGVSGVTISGIQTVGTDGAPTALSGTTNLAADSFIVLDNGDLVIRGSFKTELGQLVNGVQFWSAATQSVVPGLTLSADDRSEDDEMVMMPDGKILLTLPQRNEIVIVNDVRGE